MPRTAGVRAVRSLIDLLTLATAGVIVIAIAASLPSLYLEATRLLAQGADKARITDLLDRVLLLVLALDVTRALAAASLHRALPVRIVIETAIVAVLRELISVEIRKLTPSMVLALGAVFAVLAAAWVVIGRLETHGELREELESITRD